MESSKQVDGIGGSPSATPGSSTRDESNEPPKKLRRSSLTQNACTRCRQKKSKCDGKRPTCGRCEKHGSDCIYDVPQEGMTRMQSVQRQLETRNEAYGRLMRVFSALQHGSDFEATNLLARLRLGESIDSLIESVDPNRTPLSGAQNDSTPSQDGQAPGHMQSWPSSPMLEDEFSHMQSDGFHQEPRDSFAPELDPRLRSFSYQNPPDQRRDADATSSGGVSPNAQPRRGSRQFNE